MMIFVALALQMGQEMKDTLHDCWSRLSYRICFMARPLYETDFYYTLRFLHFADTSERPDEGKEYD